jgi:hypothetical protein
MCLYAKKRDKPFSTNKKAEAKLMNIIQIAKKDIEVYKMFQAPSCIDSTGKEYYLTPYRNFKWYDKTQVNVGRFTLGSYNSYSNNIAINEGLHAYTKPPSAYGQVMKKMIIPKGTFYIKSSNGKEIVALSMKML